MKMVENMTEVCALMLLHHFCLSILFERFKKNGSNIFKLNDIHVIINAYFTLSCVKEFYWSYQRSLRDLNFVKFLIKIENNYPVSKYISRYCH